MAVKEKVEDNSAYIAKIRMRALHPKWNGNNDAEKHGGLLVEYLTPQGYVVRDDFACSTNERGGNRPQDVRTKEIAVFIDALVKRHDIPGWVIAKTVEPKKRSYADDTFITWLCHVEDTHPEAAKSLRWRRKTIHGICLEELVSSYDGICGRPIYERGEEFCSTHLKRASKEAQEKAERAEQAHLAQVAHAVRKEKEEFFEATMQQMWIDTAKVLGAPLNRGDGNDNLPRRRRYTNPEPVLWNSFNPDRENPTAQLTMQLPFTLYEQIVKHLTGNTYTYIKPKPEPEPESIVEETTDDSSFGDLVNPFGGL